MSNGSYRRLACSTLLAIMLVAPASGQSADPNVLEYGEYLAGECTTCHQIDGTDNGIPPIIGWPLETFIAVMMSYKQGERGNQAMISVAQSLDEDQLTALGTYFSTLNPKQ